MTTIIAIEASDGLVMCADLQQTTPLGIEYGSKIMPMGKCELLGCAGASEYISIFQEYVGKSLSEMKGSDYQGALNGAIDSYGEYVANRIDKLRLSRLPSTSLLDYYPQAIFAYWDKMRPYHECHMFEINTPNPCLEIEVSQNRLATGSGGVAATIILKTIENTMSHWEMGDYSLTWRQFSVKTITELCVILLRKIEEIDAFSSGIGGYVVNETGTRHLNWSSVFSSFEERDQLPELVQNVIREITPKKVSMNLRRLGLNRILKELGLG